MSDEDERIARNIQKMLSQNASEERIAEYLASEGRSVPAKKTETSQKVPNKGTILNSFLRGATFDFADEAMGGIAASYAKIYDAISGKSDVTGKGYSDDITYQTARDSVREDQEAFAANNPKMDFAAQLAGGLMTGGSGGSQALKLLSKNAPKIVKATTLAAIAGAEGGLYGFGQGEGLDNSIDRARKQAATSAVIGPLASWGGNKILNRVFPVKTSTGWRPVQKAAKELSESHQPTRTIGSIEAEARSFYKEAEKLGVKVSNKAYGDFKDRLFEMLKIQAINPTIYPPVGPAMRYLRSLKNPTYKELEAAKKALLRGKASTNEDYARAANTIDTEIDDFIASLTKRDLDAGDVVGLDENLKKAKFLWSRKAQTETVDNMEEVALRSESMAADDFDKAMRAEIRKVINNPRKKYGMDPDVVTSLDDMIKGTRGKNVARGLAGIAPGSHTRRGLEVSIGAAAVGWATTGSPAGVILGVVPGMTGAAARKVANNITKNELNAIRNAILNKGKYEAEEIVATILEPHIRNLSAATLAGVASTSDEVNTTLADMMR